MIQTIFARFGWFVLLFALQVFVFNHVHILGIATPMPYFYFLLILSADTPRWLYVLLGFVMGFLIDLFAGTPGVAAGAMTFVGFASPWILRVFLPSDRDDDSLMPSVKAMEWSGFLKIAAIMSLLHCTVFFLLECFSFFDTALLLMNIAGSTLITFLMAIAIELIRSKVS